MTSKGRRALQLAAGLALSGLFLWLALRGENWGEIRRQLAAADYRYIAAMVPVGIYGLYVRCQRWQLLLEQTHGRPVPMLPIYSASAIGFMANMVLPFRVGEIARPFLVARSARLPVAATLASVVIERVLDLLALAAFGVAIILMADVPPVLWKSAIVAAAMAAILFAGGIFVVLYRETVLPRLDAVWRRVPKLGPLILRVEHEFVDGMAPIAHPATMIKAIAWSIYIWLIVAVSFALGFHATGIDVPFFEGGITVATIVALAVAMPSAPAFVGQFEWGCKVPLEGIFGVESTAAVSYSILVHATQFATQVLLGIVFLAREGLSLRDLTKMQEAPAAPVEGEVRP